MAGLFYPEERVVFLIEPVGFNLGMERKITNNNRGIVTENFDRKKLKISTALVPLKVI